MPVTLEARYVPVKERAGKYLLILKSYPTSRIAFELSNAYYQGDRFAGGGLDAWTVFLSNNKGRDPVEDAYAQFYIADFLQHKDEARATEYWKGFLKSYLSFGRNLPDRLKIRMNLYGEDIDRTEDIGEEAVGTEEGVAPLRHIVEAYSHEANFNNYHAYIGELARDYGAGHPVVGLAKLKLAEWLSYQDQEYLKKHSLENEAAKLVDSVAKDFAREPVCVEMVMEVRRNLKAASRRPAMTSELRKLLERKRAPAAGADEAK
jgi:hypothetical protein